MKIFLEEMVWYDVPESELQFRYNGSGELFVRNKENDIAIKVTPIASGLKLNSWNEKGKHKFHVTEVRTYDTHGTITVEA